jgi:thiol-disulfide isomerase/thioredoxin
MIDPLLYQTSVNRAATFRAGGGDRNMRIPSLIFCLLSLVCSIAGCSQTAGFRSNPPSNLKTVASLGDKPLPIVSGEPGASQSAETAELDLPPARGSRISGRVYDDRGRPVPNAKVRLAVGSSPGGRVVRATTDRSGAFTLRGLQSGLSYTLIAEYQGEDGTLTGRAQAKAPEGDARISLSSSGEESKKGYASIRPARPAVEPISNIDPADDDQREEGSANGGINDEDMDSPAPEAAATLPRTNVQASRMAGDSTRTPPRAGWNVRQTGSKKEANASPDSPGRNDGAKATSRGASAGLAGDDPDEDGPNPLPAAIERGAVSSSGSGRLLEAEPIRVARSEGRPTSRPRRDGTSDAEPGPIPADLLAGERVITPGSYAPIIVNDHDETKSARLSPRPRGRRPNSASRDLDSPSAPPEDESHSLDSSDARDSAAADRPTWRELAVKQASIPVDESIRRAAVELGPRDQNVVTLASTGRPTRSRLSRLLGGSAPSPAEPADKSECQIDASDRRLVSFKLPGVDGKLVSLRDVDADVILLDFWGSWCAPCRKSIPHLIDRQTGLAGKRFQVVGIACEKGATLAERRSSAAGAVHELGIDYPVAISSMDGSCPVQKALQIQFYPTMILLDREGRMLAREQGATDATLPRMDRAIAAALRGEGSMTR